MTDPVARSAGSTARIRIWDLPVRLFHWAIVLLFGMSWGSGEFDNLELHRLFGYGMLTALVFRVGWGILGSTTARFSSFVRGPGVVWNYARTLFGARRDPVAWGHNPMGGWSVLLILGLLFAQCGLGLFAVDVDGIESGPLNDLVSFETGRTIAHLHGFVFDLLMAALLLHLGAILFYRLVKGEDLVTPMVTGFKPAEPDVRPPPLRFAGGWRALSLLLVAASLVTALVTRLRF